MPDNLHFDKCKFQTSRNNFIIYCIIFYSLPCIINLILPRKQKYYEDEYE